MTEPEWLGCNDPGTMLEFLGGKASERKLRLFACACCRRIWPHLKDRRSRKVVEVSEDYADGRATRRKLNSAWERADIASQEIHLSGGGDVDQRPAQAVLGLGVDLDVSWAVESAAATFGAVARGEAYKRIWQTPGKDHPARWAEDDAVRQAAEAREAEVQANLLRDIVGNPFRRVVIGPSWLAWNGSTVPKLAQAVYEEGAFDRLPVLADALEDAGCTDETILAHLRGPGPHVHGCWALDVLLGKE
jgi:hypothetical protein